MAPSDVAPAPDPRIAAYVAEISRPYVPWISRSHLTLMALYREHGEDVVQDLLDGYFRARRAAREAAAMR